MPTGAQIVAAVQKQMGKRYVFGAAGPNTFDCSGLVLYVYKQFGISLPHKASSQVKRGKAVSIDDIQPGDLVFSDWEGRGNRYSHVGIAVDKNRIITAPHTGDVVRYSTLNGTYRAHITAVRRLPQVTNGAASGSLPQGGTPVGGGGSTGGGSTGGNASGGGDTGGDTGGAATGPFAVIADAIRNAFLPLTAAQSLADKSMELFLPTILIRVVCGIAGAIFLGWGTILLAREVAD